MEQHADNRERLPFDVQELKNMIGSEFFLRVIGHYWKKQKSDWLMEPGALPVINDGLIGEIIRKKIYSCEYYLLGEILEAFFEDGTLVGKSIGRVSATYVFRLESVQIEEGKPPVLTGSVQPYSTTTSLAGAPFDKKVVLHMAQIPTEKIKTMAQVM